MLGGGLPLPIAPPQTQPCGKLNKLKITTKAASEIHIKNNIVPVNLWFVVDKYFSCCSGGYLLGPTTQLNKQQLIIAKEHCNKLLV